LRKWKMALDVRRLRLFSSSLQALQSIQGAMNVLGDRISVSNDHFGGELFLDKHRLFRRIKQRYTELSILVQTSLEAHKYLRDHQGVCTVNTP
jgi:hypothetical protein